MAQKLKDIGGMKFGRLSVVLRAPNGKSRVAKWLCLCECGKPHVAFGNHLRSGVTTECTECWRAKLPNHHESGTRLYKVWCGMRKRCRNESNKSYVNYGARGIDVCQEWDDFQAFKAWSLASGYADDLTIDRIDSDKNYGPGNCRWITKGENSRLANVKRWAAKKGAAHV